MDIYLLLKSAHDIKRFAEEIQSNQMIDCTLAIIDELKNFIIKKPR